MQGTKYQWKDQEKKSKQKEKKIKVKREIIFPRRPPTCENFSVAGRLKIVGLLQEAEILFEGPKFEVWPGLEGFDHHWLEDTLICWKHWKSRLTWGLWVDLFLEFGSCISHLIWFYKKKRDAFWVFPLEGFFPCFEPIFCVHYLLWSLWFMLLIIAWWRKINKDQKDAD